jgi:hypothetical protein
MCTQTDPTSLALAHMARIGIGGSPALRTALRDVHPTARLRQRTSDGATTITAVLDAHRHLEVRGTVQCDGTLVDLRARATWAKDAGTTWIRGGFDVPSLLDTLTLVVHVQRAVDDRILAPQLVRTGAVVRVLVLRAGSQPVWRFTDDTGRTIDASLDPVDGHVVAARIAVAGPGHDVAVAVAVDDLPLLSTVLVDAIDTSSGHDGPQSFSARFAAFNTMATQVLSDGRARAEAAGRTVLAVAVAA